MPTRKFLIVLGTHPEAIKLAPLILELRRRDPLSLFVCATGQHDGMVDRALEIFGIAADLNLRVMRPGQSLAATGAAIMLGIDRVIVEHRPEWVVVQGDTVTASMAALCAFFRGCRIGHVEAGLRTGDLQQPFPEELNRRVVSIAATQHFAPTVFARENLLREGVPEPSVRVTGNTGIDALYCALDYLHRAGSLEMERDPDVLRVLVTAHRRENQDGGIRNVCLAVRRICTKWQGHVRMIWPVHPNPLVETVVRQQLSNVPGVELLDPLPYESMVRELYHADLVVSDSGGIQEEAPSLGKRVLVLRYATERPEGVRAGVADLIGTDTREVFRAIDSALENQSGRVARVSPYGDGKASSRIANFLLGRDVDQFHEAGSEPLDSVDLMLAMQERQLSAIEDRRIPMASGSSDLLPLQ